MPAQPESLILPGTEGVPLLGAAALPATATICSCHNVSKEAIGTAFDNGCCSLAEVKAETRASSGCGGCTTLLKSVVDEELSTRGMEVKLISVNTFRTRGRSFTTWFGSATSAALTIYWSNTGED